MRKNVALVTVLILSILYVVNVKYANARAKPSGGQMACSLSLAGYIQKIKNIPVDNTKDYYILRNVNNAATHVFGSLRTLTNNKTQISSNANWGTLAYRIYEVLKQNRLNALYLLFLTQPPKKSFLQNTAKKNRWTMQNADTMFISFITNQKTWWKDIQTLGDVASTFTMLIAKNLKQESNIINTNVLVQTIYALLSKNPSKGIKQVYSKYIQRIYSYKTDPITYCGLFL